MAVPLLLSVPVLLISDCISLVVICFPLHSYFVHFVMHWHDGVVWDRLTGNKKPRDLCIGLPVKLERLPTRFCVGVHGRQTLQSPSGTGQGGVSCIVP